MLPSKPRTPGQNISRPKNNGCYLLSPTIAGGRLLRKAQKVHLTNSWVTREEDGGYRIIIEEHLIKR